MDGWMEEVHHSLAFIVHRDEDGLILIDAAQRPTRNFSWFSNEEK
jgi:hypothetical protein